ncbi:AAA family ATPase [Glutamicibacter creatinolyticus]|uniref:AAA family ATPase n=1 Tax=Glutamicibacter creatinolyticus TaxID=162496 RepID=UPI003217224B
MTKIENAEINDFQRIEVARIAPSDHLIVFAGKNAQGKSSGLNALEAALTGHNSRNNPKPIREGAKRADVRLELDNGITIERKYTASGTTLTVKSTDCARYGQSKLSELIGSLGLDVSSFLALGEKKQLETLLNVVDLPFVPAELASERKAIFDARTDVNRHVKDLTAQMNSFEPVDLTLPEDEVSAAALVVRHREAVELNRRIDEAERARDGWADRVVQLEEQLNEARKNLASAQDHLSAAPPRVDTTELESKIAAAEETNTAIRNANRYRELQSTFERKSSEAKTLTAKLEDLDRRKAEGLAAAKMPVPGLTFDDDGLLYNGVPFSRASDAEKIMVSVAMMIAMQPELRSLIVRNGNNLDAAHLTELRALAERHDFQIFVELVAEHGEFEYTFRDGKLTVNRQ